MLLARLEAEDLARQIEPADLAAPILEHLVRAHGAADDLVEELGRLGFSEDLDVALERHRRADDRERIVKGRTPSPARLGHARSEEHTSELQSRLHLVC